MNFYNENTQLAAAKRAIEVAKRNNYNFTVVTMTTAKSKEFSDSLHKDMSSKDNHEFVE